MTALSPRLVPHAGSRWKRPGRFEAVLRGHAGPVNGALVLPDGRILSWSKDSTLRFWRSDGTPDGEPLRDRWAIDGALVLPDGRILSWSEDSTLRLWRSDRMPDGPVLYGHELGVTGALVLPNGVIVSWSRDRTLRLWHADGTPAGGPLRRHEAPVTAALVLPDSRILSREERMVCAWTPEGRLLRAIPFDAPIMFCDGKTIVTARDRRLVVYDLRLD
jgi:WD40 repeat protein